MGRSRILIRQLAAVHHIRVERPIFYTTSVSYGFVRGYGILMNRGVLLLWEELELLVFVEIGLFLLANFEVVDDFGFVGLD